MDTIANNTKAPIPATAPDVRAEARADKQIANSGKAIAKTVLKVDGLQVFIDRIQVLHSVSFEVPEKSITAVIGPSGCGKSVLLKSITGLLQEEVGKVRCEGSVSFQGGELLGLSLKEMEKIRRRIVYVSQHPVALPMSIYENVAFAVKYWNPTFLKAQIEDRVIRALNDADLWSECKDRLRNDPQTLSAGQLQRLCIARALALEPDLLLLDEPCAYVDPIANQKLEELFVELKRQYTILIVTHNMQQAARVSDYSSFFWLGKLVEIAETEKMFTNPDEKLSEDYVTGRFG